jgi:hypothetical protein
VNELRSRAGVLIAAAAITTSFFGSRAVSGDGLSGWVWVAVIAFIVVGGCVLAVLWPRSDWSFNASAAEIIAEYIEPEAVEFPLVQRDLALHRSTAYDDENARQLGRLFWCSASAASCLSSGSRRGSWRWPSARRVRAIATKPAPAPPTAPPQPIKPSPMQGETRAALRTAIRSS